MLLEWKNEMPANTAMMHDLEQLAIMAGNAKALMINRGSNGKFLARDDHDMTKTEPKRIPELK